VNRASLTSTPVRWVRLPPLVILGGVAYSMFATLFGPFSWPQRFTTGIPCAIALIWAVQRGWLRPRWKPSEPVEPEQRHVPAILVWLVLLVVAVGVQLFNYFDWPRTVYPTLSSLANQVFWIYPVRVASFAFWLWLGWYFIDR
jgi:hypothetical protein